MRRNQTFHETLIPILVEGIGANSYLEFGTFDNSTISKVKCPVRYGVDTKVTPCEGVRMFEMTTQEFIAKEAAKYAPFDFILIDADHSYDAVKRDFEGISKYVSAEGIICLHDTNPETMADTEPGYCGDSWKFAWELSESGVECVTLPYHPGLTIIRKRIWWGPKDL